MSQALLFSQNQYGNKSGCNLYVQSVHAIDGFVGPVTSNESIIQADSNLSALPAPQILIKGETNPNQQLQIYLDTDFTPNTYAVGIIQSSTNGTANNPLLLNPNDAIPRSFVGIGPSNSVVSPSTNVSGISNDLSYNTSLVVFGSGTADIGSGSADVLKVRQPVATNPHEVSIGFNTAGPNGVIDARQSNGLSSNIGYDLHLCPTGGSPYAIYGYKYPTITGDVFTTSILGNYSYTASLSLTGINVASIASCLLEHTGHTVSLQISPIPSQTITATGFSFTGIPTSCQPTYEVQSYAPIFVNGASTSTLVIVSVLTNGSISFQPAAGGSFSGLCSSSGLRLSWMV